MRVGAKSERREKSPRLHDNGTLLLFGRSRCTLQNVQMPMQGPIVAADLLTKFDRAINPLAKVTFPHNFGFD